MDNNLEAVEIFFTLQKDNHYIQAAWTGANWGYRKNSKPDLIGSRYNKVWAFRLDKMFDNKNITNWMSFQDFLSKDIISDKSDAEKFFYSKKILFDNLDDDFAKEVEDFISTVKYIEDKIFNHFSVPGFINLKAFTPLEEREILNQLKEFVALHLTRSKLSALTSFKKVDNLVSTSKMNKFNIPMNISEAEGIYFNKYFSQINDDNYYHYKKIIAYYDMKSSYENIIKELSNCKCIKFMAYKDSNNNILDNFFLSETPFICNSTLNNILEYKQDFLEFLQLNFLNELEDFYPKHNENLHFKDDFKNLWDFFIVGVLSKRIKVLLCKENNFLSKCLSSWFFQRGALMYDEVAVKNTFSSFICSSQDSMQKLYDYLVTFDYNELKSNYIKVNKILFESPKVTTLLPLNYYFLPYNTYKYKVKIHSKYYPILWKMYLYNPYKISIKYYF